MVRPGAGRAQRFTVIPECSRSCQLPIAAAVEHERLTGWVGAQAADRQQHDVVVARADLPLDDAVELGGRAFE